MPEWTFNVGADPVSGTKTRLIKEDGKLFFHYQSPNDALVEENKRLNTQEQRGKTRLGARVPPHLYYIDWPKEFEAKHGHHPMRVEAGPLRKAVRREWREFVIAKINSPEFRYLRIDDQRKLPELRREL